MDWDGALKLAKLISELGGINGRKRAQKIVHLLQAQEHADFRQSFILYIFGPFSRDVAAQLDFIHDADLVNEVEKDGAYHYSVSKTQKRRIDALVGDRCMSDKWSKFAAELKRMDMPFLEALSTVVFLRKTFRIDERDLRDEFDSVKPHLEDQFECALKFAKERFDFATSAN